MYISHLLGAVVLLGFDVLLKLIIQICVFNLAIFIKMEIDIMNVMKKGELKKGELERYATETKWQQLPKIHTYWAKRYLIPKTNQVFGGGGIVSFFAEGLSCGFKKDKKLRILSLGGGLCLQEQQIAVRLRDMGFSDIHIECLDMSPERCKEAQKLFNDKGISDLISISEQDINEWQPQKKYTSVMANQSLHHFHALEKIFNNVKMCMSDEGRFVVNDIIGKNGHQRWPEVLNYLIKIWEIIPQKYKFNHPFNRVDEEYDDWDYSLRTCEGIRAQDILPLINKTFDATHFVAEGGLIDVFIERKYGHNFKIDSDEDKRLIDQIAFMNNILIDAGTIKPTMMLAWFKKKDRVKSIFNKQSNVCYRHWSAEFCVRDPKCNSSRKSFLAQYLR